VGTCDTYRSSVCRSDNKIDIIKAGLEGKGCRLGSTRKNLS
jgi:hypothetical protein